MRTHEFASAVILFIYAIIQVMFIKTHISVEVTKDIKKIWRSTSTPRITWVWWVVIGVGCLWSVNFPNNPKPLAILLFALTSLVPPLCFFYALIRALCKKKPII